MSLWSLYLIKRKLKVHELLKKILYIIAALYFLISVIGGAILQSRVGLSERQLEYYRTELELATDRQREAQDAIDDCYRIATRDSEVLSKSANSIQELREQIYKIRENYEAMENRLCVFYTSLDNRIGDNSSNQIKED